MPQPASTILLFNPDLALRHSGIVALLILLWFARLLILSGCKSSKTINRYGLTRCERFVQEITTLIALLFDGPSPPAYCFIASMEPRFFRERDCCKRSSFFSPCGSSVGSLSCFHRTVWQSAQAQINAYCLFADFQGFRFHLTEKPHTSTTFVLDRAGFDASLDLSMQFDLDCADFGEADPLLMCERVAALRIGEAIIALSAFVARIARLFTALASGRTP